MNNSNYYVIGVMSGTSLDGIDLCYFNLNYKIKWSFQIIKAETIGYPQLWKDKLANAITLNNHDLDELDDSYSKYLSAVISNFIKDSNIHKDIIVCSHGHTVFHKPDEGFTKQIGNLEALSNELNNTVVCDFRVQDVELGGQGAPLVPIGDKLLFGDYKFCLNLGGFANISFEENSNRIAYDVCPVNVVLNYFSEKLGLTYDRDGEISKTGCINNDLLNELNELSYYHLSHPKSLGLEWVKEEIFPIISQYEIGINDVMRTFVEHVAIQIGNAIKGKSTGTVLVTGGGAFNIFLLERISALTHHKIKIPSNEIINNKEALIFGLLGVLKLRNEVNCLSSVTGAKVDHSSGKIFYNKTR